MNNIRSRALLVAALAVLAIAAAAGQAKAGASLPYPRTASDWAAFLAPDPRFVEIGGIPEPMPTRKLAEAGLEIGRASCRERV